MRRSYLPLLVTVGFSVLGVVGDYFLKVASLAPNPFRTLAFYVGFSLCFAPEWAIVNYIELRVTGSDALQWRNEYMNNIKGQRTGYQTQYFETMLSWAHWIGSTIIMRPELRYEHAFHRPAYDNGTKVDQFVFASDFIVKY